MINQFEKKGEEICLIVYIKLQIILMEKVILVQQIITRDV